MYWFATSDVGISIEFSPFFNIHPSEDALEEYVFKRLPEKETAGVEEHLLVCTQCCQALQNIDQFILALRQCCNEPEQRPARRTGHGRAIGWGVTLAATALGCALAAILPRAHPARSGNPVQLVAFRGGEGGAIVPAQAGAPLDLRIDSSDLPETGAYHLLIVDAEGAQIWTGDTQASSGSLAVRMSPGLKRGLYWVRLYSGNRLLREFGLRAE